MNDLNYFETFLDYQESRRSSKKDDELNQLSYGIFGTSSIILHVLNR